MVLRVFGIMPLPPQEHMKEENHVGGCRLRDRRLCTLHALGVPSQPLQHNNDNGIDNVIVIVVLHWYNLNSLVRHCTLVTMFGR